jgi:hypothetical protein
MMGMDGVDVGFDMLTTNALEEQWEEKELSTTTGTIPAWLDGVYYKVGRGQ